MAQINLYGQPNYHSLEQSLPVYTHSQRKYDIQRINHLECRSKARCIAATISSWLFCPVTFPFAILCGCAGCCNDKENNCTYVFFCQRKDQDGKGYCDWSTCEGPCWHPALPPENFSEMCLLGLDCCPFRCKKGAAESHFLLQSEMEELQKLKVRQERERAADSVFVNFHMPSDVSLLITEEIVLDKIKEDQTPSDTRKTKSLPTIKPGSYTPSYPTSSGCLVM